MLAMTAEYISSAYSINWNLQTSMAESGDEHEHVGQARPGQAKLDRGCLG
jgi:hypothetical protein